MDCIKFLKVYTYIGYRTYFCNSRLQQVIMKGCYCYVFMLTSLSTSLAAIFNLPSKTQLKQEDRSEYEEMGKEKANR